MSCAQSRERQQYLNPPAEGYQRGELRPRIGQLGVNGEHALDLHGLRNQNSSANGRSVI